MSEMERTRTVTWQDPAALGKAALSMAGAAFLRAIAERGLPPPPIASLMGFDIDEVGEGRVVFSVEPQEYHYNPIGVVHGGLAATLLDSAVRAIGKVIHLGGKIATAEGTVIDGAGKLYAHGTTTCLLGDVSRRGG